MTEPQSENDRIRRKRRIVSGISMVVFLVILILLTALFCRYLSPYLHSSQALRAMLQRYGWQGRFVLLGLQCLQVLIAFIPGEVIELGAGYAYGAIEGMIICLVGVAISSSLVFLLTKKVGIRLVEAFIPREKIHELQFINSEQKLRRLLFLFFLIPGTPKDVLTYIAGLTKVRLSEFLAITLIARIPSVLTSTVSGHILGQEQYWAAAAVYAATGAVSLLGYWAYNRILKSHSCKKKERDGD